MIKIWYGKAIRDKEKIAKEGKYKWYIKYWGEFMSQCPFWSTNKEKFGCYNECPMQGSSEEKECLFKEVSTFSKINLNDIIKGDSTYKKDELYMDDVEYLSNF